MVVNHLKTVVKVDVLTNRYGLIMSERHRDGTVVINEFRNNVTFRDFLRGISEK